MNIKIPAARLLRYLFLGFFVLALVTVLYAVKNTDRQLLNGFFYKEDVKP